jgi:hypothetical protein
LRCPLALSLTMEVCIIPGRLSAVVSSYCKLFTNRKTRQERFRGRGGG